MPHTLPHHLAPEIYNEDIRELLTQGGELIANFPELEETQVLINDLLEIMGDTKNEIIHDSLSRLHDVQMKPTGEMDPSYIAIVNERDKMLIIDVLNDFRRKIHQRAFRE